jgi:acetate---CoA ligase (ADP-forming)
MSGFDLARLMKPRSIAIVGVSPENSSPGYALLGSLGTFGYKGEIHLVSRSNAAIDGRPCVKSIDDLPDGVDLAMLMVPRAAIEDAVGACARRKIGAAIVFAAGFGEAGGTWKEAQDRFSAVARGANLALCGPNCLGIVNYVDNIPLTFSRQQSLAPPTPNGIAVVAQSGGLATVLRLALHAKGIPVTFTVSTGNEAVLGLEDYIAYLIEEKSTRVVTAFAEQIRRPQRFLQVAARARALGKPIVLLHPGRSQAARASALSHTGALAGDYEVIRTLLAHHAVVLVDSLDELIDASELMLRFPKPPAKGAAIVTDSGAFKGMALDFCEMVGLELPALSPATAEILRKELPDFIGPSNPLDLTAQAIVDLGLYDRTVTPLLKDERYGSLLLGVIIGSANAYAMAKADAILKPVLGVEKPVVFGLLGDEVELPPGLVDKTRNAGIPFFRSPERAMRALARITAYGQSLARTGKVPPAFAAPPLPGNGVLPEYRSKEYLARCGIPVPRGQLVRTRAEAETAAEEIGFPVALKIQAAALLHKTEAGGVVLGVRDHAGVAAAWSSLDRPGIDGVLVEAMARSGVEMILGARRDQDWGPVVVVGLGGVFTEALRDVRLMPADLDEAEIAAELGRLRGAALLGGMRGQAPRDVAALARIAARIGALMRARPEIREIDINPLTLFARGEGALALDASIIAD